MRSKAGTVLAGVALVVAVLGSSPVGNAAWKAVLPKASVGTAQLKANAVTSVKVKNGSLLKADFKAGQLPAGAVGPAGPSGPAGAAGAAGPTGPTGPAGISGYEIVEAQTADDSVSPKFSRAACPAGKKALGGGAVINNTGFDTAAYYSYPDGSSAWYGGYKEDTPTAGNWWGRTYVICATVS